MLARPAKPTIPNPLLQREPELVERLTAFRGQVNDILADKLTARALNDPAFRLQDCPHPLADVKATAIIVRMLTRPVWDQDDLAIFDRFWRQTLSADLFADEFVAEHHRIQQSVQATRKQLQGNGTALC